MALSESVLTRGEIDAAGALVQGANWNQTAADWLIFLDLGSVHAIREDSGRVIATAATLPYAGRFAWISMVLVAADHQRHGLARRLMQRCVDELQAAGIVPVLDATPAGRTVYLGLGFKDAWSYQRFSRATPAGAQTPAADATIRRISDAVWPALCRYDASAFGADRSAVLGRLRGRLPASEFYAERQGRIVGFSLGRDGRSAAQIGPVIADSEEIAVALLSHALKDNDRPVYIDIADSRTIVRDWLTTRGFVSQRPFTRMMLGHETAFDDRVRTVAVAGPELG